MPRSPFLPYKNATLVFNLPVSTGAVNAVGNRRRQTEPVSVEAFLKRVSLQSASQIERLPGLNSQADYWQGYAVIPMQLPIEIKPGDQAKAIISGDLGVFIIYGLINAPYGRDGIGKMIEKSAGTRFAGWFNRGGVLDVEV